jgi:hypothetical protein
MVFALRWLCARARHSIRQDVVGASARGAM